jgi:predicted enzyme related to lactoylglutathione lyase
MKFLEIAFVGYAVTDLKRARKFYEETLELTPTSTFGDDNQGWIEYDIGPGTLAIGNGAMDWKPSRDGGSGALEVDDFQASIELLKRKGVPFRFEPFESPVCWMAVISDPDGNSIVIHKRKA